MEANHGAKGKRMFKRVAIFSMLILLVIVTFFTYRISKSPTGSYVAYYAPEQNGLQALRSHTLLTFANQVKFIAKAGSLLHLPVVHAQLTGCAAVPLGGYTCTGTIRQDTGPCLTHFWCGESSSCMTAETRHYYCASDYGGLGCACNFAYNSTNNCHF